MTESEDLLMPEGARVLHIGPEKTGTTAVQFAFMNARERLRADGVCYPGKHARRRDAGFAVVGMAGPRGRRAPALDAWDDLVREVEEAGHQRVFVSNESFARADDSAAQAIVDGLGGERAHVVIVARRIDKLVASHWQQRVQAGLTLPYDEWLSRVLRDDNPGDAQWERFWGCHDLAVLVGRWSKAAAPGQVTVVVADESDRELLPRMFERFLGLEPGYLELVQDRTNRSLSLNEIEMLRLIGLEFKEHDWPAEVFRHLYRFGAITRLRRSPRQPGDRAIVLPPWAAERAAELNAARIETVRSLGVRVLGDPELLRTSPEAHADTEPSDADGPVRVTAETAAAAVTATIEAALRQQRKFDAQHRRQLRRAGKPGLEDATGRELVGELRSRVGRRLRRR